MRKMLLALFVAAAMVITVAPAQAVPIVIDFGTGIAGSGGTLFRDGADVWGSGIPIQIMNVQGSVVPGNFLTYGTAVGDGHIIPGTWASLAFDTRSATNFISITGYIPSLGVGDANNLVTLLSGTINSHGSTAQGLVSATGVDTKSPEVLRALGIPVETPFAFFGFSLHAGWIGTAPDEHGIAISTDIKNTSVPEPASMLLFGSGLVGLAGAVRRRLKK
ncbi:MAG: PEP-CTERM sorting domain-containing protein [Acidobacteria bacterium]|nr:PEP-CTERM sorting domain-containing protein [Acidobacteriota bacterium]